MMSARHMHNGHNQLGNICPFGIDDTVRQSYYIYAFIQQVNKTRQRYQNIFPAEPVQRLYQ